MLRQESSDKPNLTVYRASAGSGKTHRLTAEYLHLLFSSPFAYKHILAVTFTNRATEEMKSRIVEELSNLASGRDSDYLKELSHEYHKPQDAIREQARKILISILHDYSAFSVSTIDRFFQQTMRAFTREIGLGGGYNVELDTGKVLGEAIDSMLYDLERSENQQLLDWLIRFSEEKIESGETWNIRNDIQSLSIEIFKESYKAFSDEIQADIANKDLLDDYKKTLLVCIQQFEKRSAEIAEKALNTMLRFSLKPDDFKGGSRSTFFSFLKWANGEIKEPTDTFKKLPDDISAWYTKTTSPELKSRIEEAFGYGLNDCVCDIVELYNNSVVYQTAYEINRYFFTLGILGDVDKKIREYAAENNVMLISDTTELLNKIIQGTDTPFVYEKVGTRVDHYMIDEFQDTSGMQWNNFLPLVQDSLSAGNKNLIVGDVKQSIYRWRNSDWKLLDEQLDIDFRTNGINHQSLDTNWRSLKNIVDFNNAVFETGSTLLQNVFNEGLEDVTVDSSLASLYTRIKRAYGESYQYIPDKTKGDNEGHVKIDFVDTDENTNWQGYVLEELPQTIEQLQDKGYSLRDIAILVRTKKEGADVANRLLEYKGQNPDSKYKYDIISDEALFIRNSQSIKLVVSLLKYLRNPSDATLRALAIYEYYKFKNQLTPEETIQTHFSMSDDFPEEVSAELQRIKELPLYEMTEEIFDLFHDAMERNENIYIQAFLDMILDFSVKKSSDLDSFLQWWDESGQTKTIFTPDGQDAIRIMTIHKSKGLGFKVVIVPFCNWEIDHKLTTILWCQPKVEPFDRLKLVPVKYSQKLKNTIFAKEYFDEKLQAFIDNLNILYVAFTRAKNDLIIYSPKPKEKQKGINSISSLLWACMHIPIENTESKTFADLTQSMDSEEGYFELGETKNTTKVKDISLSDNEVSIGALTSIPFDNRLKLRLNNKYFFTENGQREYGNLMHEIVSQVNVLDDLDKVVAKYQLAGDITDAEKQYITKILSEYLSNPQIAKWYSGEYRVLNEVQILQPGGTFIRPDRVMVKDGEVVVVDYKFGEKEEKKYQKQVKNYMTQIRKMGYENVKGYLCYITLGLVVEIL